MRYVALCGLCFAVGFTGCSLAPTVSTSPEAGTSIRGIVHGGQQPIVGAHVYLLAANTTGYGGQGVPSSASNASISLLQPGATGFSDAIGAYVPTGAGGSFSLSGDYFCTPGQQVYLYVTGGNNGSNANSASGLMAILGACPGSGSFAASVPVVIVNEVSTIAAAYAFAGFASDATHVSSSGTALAQIGIANAFASAANLYNIAGGVNALATTPAGNGKVPQAEINTLGNILASCVNSTGPSSAPCITLFANASSAGSTGIVPSDTATAAINIAHNPGNAVSTLFGLPVAIGAPFQPTLSSVPNDFTVGVLFTGGGMTVPDAVAIDGSGNVWVANETNPGSISELSSIGAPISPSNGYTGGGLDFSTSIAIDQTGNVWTSNFLNGVVSKFSASGNPISPSTGYTGAGLSGPYGVAIDSSGNPWIANQSGVVKLDPSGALLSPSGGYTAGGLTAANQVAVDGTGRTWVTNNATPGSVERFSNSGNVLSGSAGYTGGGISLPDAFGLAIDASGNVWVGHNNNAAVDNILSEISSSGVALSPSSGYVGGGLNKVAGIAIDGGGDVWAVNAVSAGSISEFSNSGSAISPSTGFTAGGVLNFPYIVAIDGSGNVWITSTRTSSVTELIGAAVPVVTPLSVGTKNNTLGTRP